MLEPIPTRAAAIVDTLKSLISGGGMSSPRFRNS